MSLGYSPGIHGEEMVPGTEALIIWSFPPVQWSVIWPLTAKHKKITQLRTSYDLAMGRGGWRILGRITWFSGGNGGEISRRQQSPSGGL